MTTVATSIKRKWEKRKTRRKGREGGADTWGMLCGEAIVVVTTGAAAVAIRIESAWEEGT